MGTVRALLVLSGGVAICFLAGRGRVSMLAASGNSSPAFHRAHGKAPFSSLVDHSGRDAVARAQAGSPESTGVLIAIYAKGVLAAAQKVGTTSSVYRVTLLSAGTATLNVTKTTVTDNFTVSGCITSLAPGKTCDLSIKFAPKSTGILSGTLTITDNAPDSPQVLPLSGVGTNSAVNFNPPSLSFGPQVVGTTSGTVSVSMANAIGSTLTITSITPNGDFTQTNNCGASLTVTSACFINVTFTPSTTGTLTGTITVTDSGGDSPQTVSLSGTGAITGLSFSPASLAFANQTVGTVSSAKSVTVTNTGSASVNFISINAGGDYAQTNTCGTSLASGSNCSISVTFMPSAKGTRTGHITLSDTDPSNLQSLGLSGTGIVPSSPVAVSPQTASVTLTQTQLFQATINGVPSTDVTWSVDNIVGGNSTVGTISTSGLYTPPAVPGPHTVTATSNARPNQKASSPMVVTNYAGTFTWRNGAGLSGENLSETVLTTGNVNTGQFGKLFSDPVDGKMYAQPLYVANVNVLGQGFHNVVYVATEHDSVYAFDADSASTPLWQDSFIDPANGITTLSIGVGPGFDINCNALSPEVGITSTPVIDPNTNTLYVVARTKEVSGSVTNFVQRLHALDITSGAERPGSPVVIQATVPGTGIGTDGQGNVSFDSLHENPRTGLLLSNGVVYITWANFCDQNPTHGWVMGYDESSLQQIAVFNLTPNGEQAGVWASGAAPAVDASGNLYFASGNGPFDASLGSSSYGDSILKLSVSGGSPSVADYFTPYNQYYLSSNARDLDLGSGGVMLLPDQPTSPTHLLIGGGKEGTLYLVDRDDMGQFNLSDNSQIVQSLVHAVGGPGMGTAGIWSSPAYYENLVYYAAVGDVPKAFRLYNGLLSDAPVSTASVTLNYPGAEPVISANGTTNGILWFVKEPTTTHGLAALYAYDAANLANALYNSTGKRDQGGAALQFGAPTVANGKVYVGTTTELDVFGLLP